MTTDQQTFVNNITLELVNQGKLEKDSTFLSKQDLLVRRYMFILKRVYAKILTDYFDIYYTEDINFCLEEEIQIVLDRFNALCNTNYTVNTTITEYNTTAPPHIWDDTIIWDDTTTWED
jgi:hypothetical protein